MSNRTPWTSHLSTTMRKLLPILLMLAAGWLQGADPAYVGGNATDWGEGYTHAVTYAITTGNKVIVWAALTAAEDASLADDNTHTWTEIVDSIGSVHRIKVWITTAAATGSQAFTLSTNLIYATITVVEYSGLTASPFDKTAGADHTSTTSLASGTTAATTEANELILGFFTNNASTYTAGSGFTKRLPAGTAGIATEDKLVSSTGTQQATMTAGTSGSGRGVVVTLKAADQPAAGVRRTMKIIEQ